MNSPSLVSEPKRKKSNGKHESHECSQSLNDFHDAILNHILSFLPTKLAVRTSVLSKRWEYMWTSLPNLDFDESCTKRKQFMNFVDGALILRKQFMNFVDRALIFHNVPSIWNFSLCCDVKNESKDVSRIKAWISGAVRRNAQELDISFHWNDIEDENVQYVLPFCLFSFETVEVLKLVIRFGVQLPSHICLSQLKTLTLKGITFKDYHATNLLFASQALKELAIRNCTWKGDEDKLIISTPKLWKLTINEFDENWMDASHSIIISAPKLGIFRHGGGFLKDYCFPRSPSIIDASLYFHLTWT